MTKTPAERLVEAERQIFVLQMLLVVALALAGFALVAAVTRRGGDAGRGSVSESPGWQRGPEGELLFFGEVWASRFVGMDRHGGRGVVLGDPGGVDSGPGVHVYATDGQQTVAAMWREDFAGRSRLRIGDSGAKPVEVIGNGPGALLVAPGLVTHQDPIVRAPSE